MSSILHRKWHKQYGKKKEMRELSGAEKGTAQGQAIIRHRITQGPVLCRVKTGTRRLSSNCR